MVALIVLIDETLDGLQWFTRITMNSNEYLMCAVTLARFGISKSLSHIFLLYSPFAHM